MPDSPDPQLAIAVHCDAPMETTEHSDGSLHRPQVTSTFGLQNHGWIVDSAIRAQGLPLSAAGEKADLQLQFAATAEGRQVELHNHGKPLTTHAGQVLSTDECGTFRLPLRLESDQAMVCIESERQWLEEQGSLQAFEPASPRDDIPGPTFASLAKTRPPEGLPQLHMLANRPPSVETLSLWFQSLIRFQQHSASSRAYLTTATELLIEPGGLDGGGVAMWQDGAWCPVASAFQHREHGGVLRTDMLDLARATRGVICKDAPHDQEAPTTAAYITAPIFDLRGEVIGAVFGSRRRHAANGRRNLRTLECQWVELVAAAIGAGLARKDAELQAARQRVLLEHVFPAEIADRLEHDPQALRPQRRVVTLLFADMRHSSRLASACGPEEFNRIMSELLSMITHHVDATGGVVIDYAGDGVAAMWNAPTDQADHASRGCRAALSIRRDLAKMRRQWTRTDIPLGLSMGIHTGEALVGNTGSTHRIKYGPRGGSVAMAARIETAAKALGVPIAISAATHELLEPALHRWELGAAKLPSFSEPVPLFAVIHDEADGPAAPDERKFLDAVQRYEQGDATGATSQLAAIDPEDSFCLSGDLLELTIKKCQFNEEHFAENESLQDNGQACFDIEQMLQQPKDHATNAAR